jgi:hypothetical protein
MNVVTIIVIMKIVTTVIIKIKNINRIVEIRRK